MEDRFVNLCSKLVLNDPNITTIFFHDHGGKDENIIRLSSSLMENTMIRKLQLDRTRIDVDAINAIGQLLQHNTTIEKLTLCPRQGDTGAIALGLAIPNFQSLKILSLRESRIGPDGGEALARGLERNQTIEELNLRDNMLGNRGAEAIAAMLRINQKINSLNVSYNRMTDKGIVSICGAFSDRPSSQSASVARLEGNDIHDEGILAACKMIQCSPSMREIAFDCCGSQIGTKKKITGVMEQHYAIEYCHLRGAPDSLSRAVQFYISLNRLGRKYIMDEKFPSNLWPRVFAVFNQEKGKKTKLQGPTFSIMASKELRVEMMHYYVRCQPHLFKM